MAAGYSGLATEDESLDRCLTDEKRHSKAFLPVDRSFPDNDSSLLREGWTRDEAAPRMRRLTEKQVHVLEGIERVEPLPYKLCVRAPLSRYQLDGRDCTAQITALVVRGLIKEMPDRSLSRIFPPPSYAIIAKSKGRQSASQGAVDLMRASLLAPVKPHRDPDSASARAGMSGASTRPQCLGHGVAKPGARATPFDGHAGQEKGAADKNCILTSLLFVSDPVQGEHT